MQDQSYYTLIGVLVVIGGGLLVSVTTFLSKYRKTIIQDMQDKAKNSDEARRLIYEIKDEIAKMNALLQTYIDKLNVQELRVTKHGGEIDDTKKRVTELEKKVGNLEFKVSSYHES